MCFNQLRVYIVYILSFIFRTCHHLCHRHHQHHPLPTSVLHHQLPLSRRSEAANRDYEDPGGGLRCPPGEGVGLIPSRPLSMNLGEDFFKSIINGFVLTEDFLIWHPMCCLVNLPGLCIYTGPKLFSRCPSFMDSYVTLCILYLHCVSLYANTPYLIVILQKFTPTIVHTSPSPV
jgi:hypothetical protein